MRPPLPSDFTGLMIAIPAYGSTVHVATCWSLSETVVDLAMQRISHQVNYVVSESMVTRARDRIVADFLGTPGFSHLLMIDADVEFPRTAALRLLGHMVHHDAVMAVYPRKKQPIDYAFTYEPNADGRARVHPVTGCVEIVKGPAGFFMVSRRTVQSVCDANPHLKYEIGEANDEHRYALFNPDPPERGVLFSEDITFCRRLRAIGGAVWMDPRIALSHWSGNVPFVGACIDDVKGA